MSEVIYAAAWGPLAAEGSSVPWGVIVPVGIGVVLLLWAVGVYNRLVRRRNHVDEKWADIETELKRRYNLIPNLVETVKGTRSTRARPSRRSSRRATPRPRRTPRLRTRLGTTISSRAPSDSCSRWSRTTPS